jgi:hypothetical protein
MSQRIAFYIAAGITAFMLFTAGGLVRITTQSPLAAVQVITTSAPKQSTVTHEQDDHHDDEPVEQDNDKSRG